VKCDSTKKCQETNLIVNFLETQFKAQQASRDTELLAAEKHGTNMECHLTPWRSLS
jgi:hypothetical protein